MKRLEILEQLKSTGDMEKLTDHFSFNENSTFRMFEAVKINDELYISIQASYGHYCSPRKTLLDITQYTEMEMAFVGKEGLMAIDKVDPLYSRLGLLVDKLDEYFDGSSVYAYVPVELINEIYLALKD
jgi:hypothetical protein